MNATSASHPQGFQAAPDFLAIGHVAKDLAPGGFKLGGAVTYGALTALRMGLSPALVTSAGGELDLGSAMPGVQVHTIPAPETSTFINTYCDGRRTQLVKGVARLIAPSDIPPQLRAIPMVMLGPLVGEVDYGLSLSFPSSTVVASMQGWLRRWDREGRIGPAYWEGKEVLPYLDAAICSMDDIGDLTLIDLWKKMAPVLIITKGRKGAILHLRGQWHEIEPFPAREVDPTGAGDVFAAAYLIRYRESGDPLASARFASCAASFCVEAQGVEGIPVRQQVEARLKGSPWRGA